MSITIRLPLARRANNLSQEDLAQASGVALETVQGIEDGSMEADVATLQTLANAMNLDPLFLLRQMEPTRVTAASAAFGLLGETEQQMVAAQAEIWLERYLDIESYYEANELPYLVFPPGFPRPAGTASNVAEAAIELRAAWQISILPIKNLCDLLENVGFRVGVLPDIEGFDACSFVTDDELALPLLVFNWNLPGDEQRFALAREMAYFFMNDMEDPRLAQHFSAAFLLPAQVARYQFGKERSDVELFEVYLMKQQYGISMRRAITRLASLRVITTDAADNWMRAFAEEGWDEKEPGIVYQADFPQRMLMLALRLQTEGRVTEEQAAAMVGMNLEAWQNMLSLGVANRRVPPSEIASVNEG